LEATLSVRVRPVLDTVVPHALGELPHLLWVGLVVSCRGGKTIEKGDADGHRGFGSLVCCGSGSVIAEAGAALVVHDRIGKLARAMISNALRIQVPDLCGAGSRVRTGRRPSAR